MNLQVKNATIPAVESLQELFAAKVAKYYAERMQQILGSCGATPETAQDFQLIHSPQSQDHLSGLLAHNGVALGYVRAGWIQHPMDGLVFRVEFETQLAGLPSNAIDLVAMEGGGNHGG